MAEISIRRLTPAGASDILAFFDGDAFADNPGWRFCYCNFMHHPHDERPWRETTAEKNREATRLRICGGGMRGQLATDGDRVVGWCQAAPRASIPALMDAPDPGGFVAATGSIVCFVIAKPYRRQGIARRLLLAACDDFRAQGLAFAEAYPRPGLTGDGENHYGPMSLYLNEGFAQVAEDPEGAIVMRKAL